MPLNLAVLLGTLLPLFLCASAWPLNVTEIILDYGYPCENHVATTPDGYILSIQRIPYGVNDSAPLGKKPVVFFQHGVLDCSVGICLNPPTESLPFILADAGFDVWLGNNRGNGYSMSNVRLKPSEDAFWAFTWDEMAQFDLPTQLSYVRRTAGVEQVIYIGHSQGTTQAWSGFLNQTTASMVNLFIAMAPVAYTHHVRSLLLQAAAHLDLPELISMLGLKEFDLVKAVQKLLPGICYEDPAACEDILALIVGPSTNLNKTRMDYYFNYEPNPTSVLDIIHWAQGVDLEKFQKMDYGKAGNMKHYGQSTPPQYNLSQFPNTLPFALFTGGNDYLADPKDVSTLVASLPSSPVLLHFEPTYAHMDFLWAEDAHVKIYPLVVELCKKYQSVL